MSVGPVVIDSSLPAAALSHILDLVPARIQSALAVMVAPRGSVKTTVVFAITALMAEMSLSSPGRPMRRLRSSCALLFLKAFAVAT
jgi:hypothetical protein